MADVRDFSAMSLAETKGALKGHRGHHTRALKFVQELVQMEKKAPSDLVVKQIHEAVEKLKVQTDNVAAAYDRLTELDGNEENQAAYVRYANESMDEFTQLLDIVNSVLNDRKPAVALAAGPAHVPDAPHGEKPKAVSALKPKELHKDMSPAEFRAWTINFRSYYNESNFKNASLSGQKGYLRSCLSANLAGRLEQLQTCLLYTSPSPRDGLLSRMPSSA